MGAKYISAGAGSGKTYRLTHDLADLLVPEKPSDQPLDASGIILTTFTKAAAADFVRKAREVLIDKKKRPDKASELDDAMIGTVHSICESFIRKYWYRLGLTLPLNILSEEDKKLYMSRIAEIVTGEDDVLFFSEFAREFEMNEDFWKGALSDIIDKKHSFGIKDLTDSRKESCRYLRKIFSGTGISPSEKDKLVLFLKHLLVLIKADNAAKGVFDEAKTGMKRQRAVERAISGSVFYLASFVLSIIVIEVKNDKEKKSVYTQSFGEELDGVYDLNKVAAIATRYLLSQEVGDRLTACTEKLFDLAEAWEKEYRSFKTKNGLLDFNDLEQKFILILTDDKFVDIRKDISATYKEMMVDEFQDSNPVQIDIFREMKRLVENNVFVGDEKQAIYGFRGTESSLVEDFIGGFSESDRMKLGISYRSRPELVNAANEIFSKAFSLPIEKMRLEPDRTELEGMDPALQHWTVPLKNPHSSSTKLDYRALGKKILELVESKTCQVVHKVKDELDSEKEKEVLKPIRFGDIAILLRNGTRIAEIAEMLRTVGVPVSIQEKGFLEWAEVQLILSLVRFVFNPADKGARADIAHLVEGMSTREIITGSKGGSDLAPTLFERLETIRKRIAVLSVSEIVESLALELDLYGNTAEWGLSEARRRNIGFMVSLARQYEQLCANMNAAPSLPGYIDYVTKFDAEKRQVDRTDTVKILTCHSAKGLEWPMVILDELDSLDISDQAIAKREIRGVHTYRPAGSDKVLLYVFPSILYKKTDTFSSSGSIPLPIVTQLASTDYFKYVQDRLIKEERRLLYVAFTRARDYLVTLGYWYRNPEKRTEKKSSYSWIMGCDAGINRGLSEKGFLLWHDDYPSYYTELPLPEEAEDLKEIILAPWKVPEAPEGIKKKYRSPSKVGKKDESSSEKPSWKVELSEVIRGKKIEQNVPKEDSAVCGTCVHDIFAAFDPAREHGDLVSMAQGIIDGRGLGDKLTSAESVIDVARQLYGWLENLYGPGTPLCELPFVIPGEGGTVIRGEMDLVWELADGECVLVDHKSYHETEDFDDPNAWNEYYGYAPQLKAYKETLEAAGYTVRDTLIHYFFQGRLVRFDFKGL